MAIHFSAEKSKQGKDMQKKFYAVMACFCLQATQLVNADISRAATEIEIGEITVEANREAGTQTVPAELLESGRFVNVGEILTETPGVSAVRRGASATEPVIRGLGWERVSTQVDGLPLHGACPARMDPPITYVRAYASEDITIIKGLASVSLGPAGSGGRIIIDTDYERSPDAPAELGGWVKLSGETNREGVAGEIGMEGGNEYVDIKASLEALDYSDYETGGGITIPANQEEYSGALSLGVRPTENHRWSNYLSYIREENIDYPSLPMNMDETDFLVYTTGYRITPESGAMSELDFSFGLQNIDHLMSNREKPNRKILEAETPSESDSYSGGAKATFLLGQEVELKTGIDYSLVQRDATRTRKMVMTGMTFKDRIWPDASQSDVGGYAEAKKQISDTVDIRIDGRFDFVSSDAEAVDEMSLQKKTVREQFVRFYGPEAAEVKEDETLGSGNIVVNWQTNEWLTTYLGTGLASRAAGVTERYFAFAPAPGGFQVGNPTLDPEQKIELELGGAIEKEWFDAEFSLFHNWVNDYILQTQIDSFDANGDGTPDVIKGFENVDARLYGFEAGLVFYYDEHLSFPLSLSYVRGKNSSDNRDLPEIPPLEATAAVRFDYGKQLPWWLEFGGRFADRQDNIDETFPEDETAGFAVFHLRGGCTIAESWKLEVGIENLLDTEYNEHLTRESFFSEGDLKAGDEIAAPGISLYASLRWEF